MNDKKTPSFEEAISRLETLVQRLEGGELSLAESLDVYSEAIALSRTCTELLGAAEQKVRILAAGGDGALTEQPFAAEVDR